MQTLKAVLTWCVCPVLTVVNDYAGAINATVSMFQYLYETNTFWGTKHLEML